MAGHKKQEKELKQRLLILFVVLFFVIGGVCGFFVGDFLTKDDGFEIIGEKLISLNLGDEYIEQGAKAVAFGKEIRDIKIESNVDTTTEGNYYVKYTVDNIRFRGVVRYRLVVVKASEVEE